MISRAKRAAGAAVLSLAIAATACAAHDMNVSREKQFVTRAAIATIETYRKHLSPRAAYVVRCRFTPTCSAYGLQAVRKYGGYTGTWMAVKRVARCNPWTEPGTIDEP